MPQIYQKNNVGMTINIIAAENNTIPKPIKTKQNDKGGIKTIYRT